MEGLFFALSIDPRNIAVDTQGECNVINPVQRGTSSLSTRRGILTTTECNQRPVFHDNVMQHQGDLLTLELIMEYLNIFTSRWLA